MLEIVFWASVGLLVYAHAGYPLLLWLLARARPPRPSLPRLRAGTPLVSLIIAAYDEEAVIADKIANALALDYPRERLELIVASDGSTDSTAERARRAGADVPAARLTVAPRRSTLGRMQGAGENVAMSVVLVIRAPAR